MNVVELQKIIADSKNTVYVKVITLEGVFEDSFLNVGMIFPVMSVNAHKHDDDDGTLWVNLNANMFKDYNRQFYECTYYDRNHNPVWNAEQAGCFPKNGVESLCVMPEDCMFEVVDEPTELVVKIPLDMMAKIRILADYVDHAKMGTNKEDVDAINEVIEWLSKGKV